MHPDGCPCCRNFSSTQQSVEELDFAKSACSAAKSGDCERLRKILSRYPGTIHHDGVDGRSGYTPLHYAARAGRLEAVLLLVKSGADVNKRTIAGGATSLHRAAYMGHTSIVEVLINHGADGCVQDSDGETPTHKAFSQNHIELGTLLLKHFPKSGTLFDRFGRLAEELSSGQEH